MTRFARLISKTLSVRLSLKVVAAIATLLTVSLFIMFHYSRRAMKEEALQKATQTLEATVQHIDNTLLSVEQSAGNIYFNMLGHLNNPDDMFLFCRKLVESNPFIQGCAIAFEPYHYENRGKYFMAYVHHSKKEGLSATNSPIIQSDTFGNLPYTEQRWYTMPVELGHPCWVNPVRDNEPTDDSIISFCLPIYNSEGKIIGVMGVDVSISLLSAIVLQAKPSPNSYCTLLADDGSYIVHPDTNRLLLQKAIMESDPTVREAAQAMLSGETGYKPFRLNGTDNYVFYKPFERKTVPGRSAEKLGWSVGIIYPEDDIFGEYNRLLYIVLAIAIAGLFLLLVFCQLIAHHQLLPLRTLTESAQRIASGHYEEAVELNNKHGKNLDEVGRLQQHFQIMKQSLADHMNELNKLTETLQDRNLTLQATYQQAKEADRMKTAVLHNMSNMMIPPVDAISNDVNLLYERYGNMERQEASQLTNDIQVQGTKVTEILNKLLEASQEEELEIEE